MYRISKRFGPYAAMHYLTTVAEDHPCRRPHGHGYEIEVVLAAPALDARGFVVDYDELSPFHDYASSLMDHRNLNEQFNFSTTTENLAHHFYCWINNTQAWPVECVRVSETPGKTMGEYNDQ